MIYLITGITGFVGPHLANLLIKEGHEVFGLVRRANGMETDILDVVPPDVYSKITFLYGDFTRKDDVDLIFKKYSFDGCFHLGAMSLPPLSFVDPVGTMNTNVMGSVNIIHSISEWNPMCKLCEVSTSEVYGNTGSDGRLLRVGDRLLPSNPYGASKAAVDLFMQERMTNGNINGFVTRAFSHTGLRRGKNFSISSDAYQLALMANGIKKDRVLCVGNLETTRVVIDVRDVVRAYYMLMINPGSNGGVFNVCGDTPHKMGYFTDELIRISGLDVTKKVSPNLYRPIDIAYQHGDVTELVNLTGWKPEIPIEQTLTDLYNYWLQKTLT